MLLLMAVTLFTSRVVLSALGVEDFGIYNVVGGVVAMFSILSGSLSAAISRFITFELGKGNKERLSKIFSSAIIIQVCIAIIICIVAEILGVWFLNAKMNIPANRMDAANWVLQCSIFTFMVNLISVPYNAAIIAHERMKVFAYIGILEALLKLAVAYVLYMSFFDKLKLYAVLLALVAIIIRLIYGHYCKKHFEECSFHLLYDKSVLKDIGEFAGWNFIGSASGVLRDQGGNIIINLFFGPAVNAARGIAFQVHSAVQAFITNLMTALDPQITKNYAIGNKDYLMFLIYQGARFSYYLVLLLSLPILLNTEYILRLWLGTVPLHTVNFVRLVLVFTLSESLSRSLVSAQNATGKIRNYQIVVGGLQMMNLPISYMLLHCGYIPETVLIVSIIVSQCCLAARLYMMRHTVGISAKTFIRKVYVNAVMVSMGAFPLPLFMAYTQESTFAFFLGNCLLTLACTILSILYIGCDSHERMKIKVKGLQLYKKYLEDKI